MSKLERERERDSWKANLRSELSETPAETMNTPTPRTDEFLGTLERHEGRIAWSIKDIEALVDRARQLDAERDQLRKVADELANIIYVHSLRPQNALDGYNQLPHVRARKTK